MSRVLPENLSARDGSPPPVKLLLGELRALAEWPRGLLHLPTGGLPRGDGHAVIVLPGFGADDRATRPLRRALERLGYAVEGWGQGRNLGMRRAVGEMLDARIETLAERIGRVSLVGWSLGGVFARELARGRPDAVRRVITLGSPITHHPQATNMERIFRMANPKYSGEIDWAAFTRREAAPPVPCTAVYSPSDGIVAARCCRELPGPNTENVAVRGSHMAMVANPHVLRVVAERLALPDRD